MHFRVTTAAESLHWPILATAKTWCRPAADCEIRVWDVVRGLHVAEELIVGAGTHRYPCNHAEWRYADYR